MYGSGFRCAFYEEECDKVIKKCGGICAFCLSCKKKGEKGYELTFKGSGE